MNRLYYLILLLLTLIPLKVHSWNDKIINYRHDEYNAGFQNWMIKQHHQGWIYFANNEGLLEFDGVFWDLHEIPNTMVRSLFIEQDTIYVGGSSEFGFFIPNEIGSLTYHTLTNQTKDWSGEVWNIVSIDSYIYFITDGYVHKFNPRSLTVQTSRFDFKIDCSTVYQNKLYLGTIGGVYQVDLMDLKAHLVAGSNSLGEEKISALIADGDRLIVVTQYKGLFTLKDNKLIPHATINTYLANKYPLFSASKNKNILAVGTVNSGICLFDEQNPKLFKNYDSYTGLNNNTVLSTFFDQDGNLWLGMDKGISYIELDSPIQPMFSTISPIGTGYCSKMYNGNLYLGTNQGLYLYNNGKPTLVNGAEGQIWSINEIGKELLIAGDNGITILNAKNKESYHISKRGVWEVKAIRTNPNYLLYATYSGICALKRVNGKWVYSHVVEGCGDSTAGFIEDINPQTFWYVNSHKQIERITLDDDFRRVIDRKVYQMSDTIVDKFKTLQYIDNRLIACSNYGILEYSRVTDSFHPSEQLESILDGKREYRYLYVDTLKNIWYVTHKELKFLEYKEGHYAKRPINLGMSYQLINGYQNVELIHPQSALIAVENGFIKAEIDHLDKVAQPIKAFIHSIVVEKENELVYYRNKETSYNLQLSYQQNTIAINYGALAIKDYGNILYSFRLENDDKEWCKPISITKKEYTNLKEGTYTFEVAVVDEQGNHLSNTASVTFTIAPPWFRSIWAYIGYFILLVGLFYLVYQRITLSKRLELINQRKKHQAITKLKDQRIIELQNENLKNKLEYQSQELSGQMLHVISKNETLEKVRDEALKLSKAIDEKTQPNTLKQHIVRLIAMINHNLGGDDNFEAFQSNFDLVHRDFFRILDLKHPTLSRNDKVLCAYLYMNLISKEIAPLMNISVRGVEVNRYRLRKKLGLEREENLTEYLQSLIQENSLNNPSTEEK